MPYNTEQHAAIGYVDKTYKDLLDQLCSIHKRSLKAELEYLITEAAKTENIT